MAKNKKRRITTGGHVGNVQAPTIILQQTRRGGLDVGVYMSAIRSAEVIDYPRKEKLCDLYEDVKIDSHLETEGRSSLDTYPIHEGRQTG